MSSVSALGRSLIRPVNASRATNKARQDNISDNLQEFDTEEADLEEESERPEPGPDDTPLSVSAAPHGDIAKTRMTAGADIENSPQTKQVRLKCVAHRLKDTVETQPAASTVLNRRL